MKCLLEIYDGRRYFYQWDTGQKLLVSDPTINQVHFAHAGMDDALVTEVYESANGDRVCNVPDIILQIDKTLVAYAYVKVKDQGETLYTVKFQVITREIPSNYIANQDAKFDKLDERVVLLEEKVGDQSVSERVEIAKNELINNAPSDLNTLGEIANALNNDKDFAKNIESKLIPVGGIQGQVLTKATNTDFDVAWKAVGALADKSYIHDQKVPSASWTIVHNLDKYPSVTIVDSADTVVVGEVNYVDTNSVVVTFSGKFSGKGYIN